MSQSGRTQTVPAIIRAPLRCRLIPPEILEPIGRQLGVHARQRAAVRNRHRAYFCSVTRLEMPSSSLRIGMRSRRQSMALTAPSERIPSRRATTNQTHAARTRSSHGHLLGASTFDLAPFGTVADDSINNRAFRRAAEIGGADEIPDGNAET
jgi:hypothetical protein